MLTPAGRMRRKHPTLPFAQVQRGALFECDGNVWHKVSSRTAVMYWPAGPERAFYFGMREPCHAERLQTTDKEQMKNENR